MQQAGAPGIVEDRPYAPFRGRGDDGGRVGDFEGERARRFEEDGLGVRAKQRGDLAADARIEPLGFHAHGFEAAFAKAGGRAIGAVGEKEMVSGGDQAGDGERAGLQAVPGEPRVFCAFKVAHCRFEFAVHRQTHAAIGGLGAVEARFVPEQDGRGALQRRVHGDAAETVRARVDEARFGGGLVLFHAGAFAIGREGSEAQSVHEPS